MIHLRIVSPPDRTDRVVALLEADDAVCNLITLRDVAQNPHGDLVMADVAREDASLVVADLRALGILDHGSIAIERIDTSLGLHSRRAIAMATGEEADAVVWEEVQSRTSEEASLSFSYVIFMLLAGALGACGLFTDNPILIVGAMVVSPDFGPMAGVCVGIVTRRAKLAARSLLAIVVGFPAASAMAYVLAEVLLATGGVDKDFSVEGSTFANLIATPDVFTFIVAFCAGAAGTLSLTTAKSGALIGVVISVTTVPAACDIGVSAATSDWSNVRGSAIQLGANIVTIILAGSLTLWLQRLAYHRKRRAHDLARDDAANGQLSGSSPTTTTPRASS